MVRLFWSYLTVLHTAHYIVKNIFWFAHWITDNVSTYVLQLARFLFLLCKYIAYPVLYFCFCGEVVCDIYFPGYGKHILKTAKWVFPIYGQTHKSLFFFSRSEQTVDLFLFDREVQYISMYVKFRPVHWCWINVRTEDQRWTTCFLFFFLGLAFWM